MGQNETAQLLPGHARVRLIVIGASLGGLEALRVLTQRLPADLDAALLVVMHIGARPSVLPQILSSHGGMPATHAVHGERIVPGKIYIAPPDQHLLVEDGVMVLQRGPKEHHTRPAIDPLFRSAALAGGERVIGVILTGMLDDGTAGLQAVKEYGGIAIVQEPSEAMAPSMPASALKYVDVDHCLTLASIADRLAELVRAEPLARPVDLPSTNRRLVPEELAVFQSKGLAMEHLVEIAKPSAFVCPDCKGGLWELTDSKPLRYRCHTGHAFTLRTLEDAQSQATEEALWTAYRALQEKQLLLKKLADVSASEGDADRAGKLHRQAEQTRLQAEAMHRLLERVET